MNNRYRLRCELPGPQGGCYEPDTGVVQTIYLEPMEPKVLFALDGLRWIEPDGGNTPLAHRRAIALDRRGDVTYEQQDGLAFRYRALSRPEVPPRALLERPLDDYRGRLADYLEREPDYPYLQLPPGLSPQVVALGAQIVGDARTVGEAVERTERFLSTRYQYTLDLKRNERYAPLEDFLFVQRRGHCEYFATAMVILLRTQGIAARPVNGFLGGEWNDFGGYLAIRQGDAHAWVEVALSERIWMLRDPTPSASQVGQATPWVTRLDQYADALRMRWYKYFVEYDLSQQLDAIDGVRTRWRALKAFLSAWFPGAGVCWGLAVGLVLLALFRIRRRGVARSLTARQQAQLVALLERALSLCGGSWPPELTAREAVEALERHRPGADLTPLWTLLGRYEAARFGQTPVTRTELKTLNDQLLALKRLTAG